MSAMVDLEAEYRLTRAALMNAGVDMTDCMDGFIGTGVDGVIS
jgi:hypothetical protein